MRSIVQDDPWWFADPHRKAYVEQILLGPTFRSHSNGAGSVSSQSLFSAP
jgi:hypothetical protein